MEDCSILSTSQYPYNLYSGTLGLINVRTSRLLKNRWNFGKNSYNLDHDYDILVCLNENNSAIERVFIIPANNPICNNLGFAITNSEISIKRFKEFEIDSDIFNQVYQNIDTGEIPEFKNFKK